MYVHVVADEAPALFDLNNLLVETNQRTRIDLNNLPAEDTVTEQHIVHDNELEVGFAHRGN